jgi:hypothetical protein
MYNGQFPTEYSQSKCIDDDNDDDDDNNNNNNNNNIASMHRTPCIDGLDAMTNIIFPSENIISHVHLISPSPLTSGIIRDYIGWVHTDGCCSYVAFSRVPYYYIYI